MNKKVNTVFFILGATVFNMLSTAICFVILLFAFTGIISLLPETMQNMFNGWGLPFSFIGSIISSFFIYRFVLKKINKKYLMEKHFDPIFGKKISPPENKN